MGMSAVLFVNPYKGERSLNKSLEFIVSPATVISGLGRYRVGCSRSPCKIPQNEVAVRYTEGSCCIRVVTHLSGIDRQYEEIYETRSKREALSWA